MRVVNFELTGETPLFMHADDVIAADSLTAWRKASANKSVSRPGDDRSPAWTWMTYMYKGEDGYVSMPSCNVSACLMKAAASIILKGQKTFKSLSQSGMVCVGQDFEFLCNGKRISFADIEHLREIHTDFDAHVEAAEKLGIRLDVRRAVVGSSKHVRVRPRFQDWAVKGAFKVLASELTNSVIAEMFDIAGNQVGLGDWRPGGKTPGSWGIFKAKIK